MLMPQQWMHDERAALAGLLGTYSVEVTSRDTKSLADVSRILPRGTEVFVANLPTESADVLIEAAARLRSAGLIPVPHIVARNVASKRDLEHMLAGLASKAGVERALVLGGDRDQPAGEFDAALQIIQSGLLEKNGIRRIAIACYPEGHPRIPGDVLRAALKAKIAAAASAGLDVLLVSQFAFDPAPIIDFVSELRRDGMEAPVRVGVAGPADRLKLVKYAIRCGVGASLRVLRERSELARNVLSGETPDDLLGQVALAQASDPSLGIAGVHFFTFGDPARSARWAEEQRSGAN
ncbi:methylenetetrahydrofolate reductase [Chelativorans sp. J32]|uniref:methylenetetrahydrofolate reductase n=1 Tax=Chelativorans sp. J32 TaxID=935840 RepID=UPI000485E363|nr:methylenetetrahydrofolate reductase [Chelativorans sp. J32]